MRQVSSTIPLWLTSERIRAWCLVLLVIEIITFLFFIAGTHGWIVRLETPVSTDFVSFYAAGALAWDGTPALAYDMASHYQSEQIATEPGVPYNFFFYPPVFLLLFAPLSRLPYLIAYIIFESGTLGLYCLAIRPLIVNRDRSWWILIVAFPAVFWTLGLSQNSFLTAALFCAGTRLLERRPVLAGILLGALCYKPHIGLLIPVALMAGRHSRAFFAATGTVCLLVCGSIAAFGWETWQAFIEHFSGSSSDVYGSGRIDFTGVVTPFASMRLLGFSPVYASVVQLITGVAAAVIVWRTWRGDGSLALRSATLLGATLLAAPVLLLYDLMLAQVALLWMLFSRMGEQLKSREIVLVAVIFTTPIVCRPIAQLTHVQIGFIAAICLLIWVRLESLRTKT